MLDHMYNLSKDDNGLIINRKTQMDIEKLVMDEFDFLFGSSTKDHITGGIDSSILSHALNSYITGKKDILIDHIRKMKKSLVHKTHKREDIKLMAKVLTEVEDNFILNLCLVHFLLVCTHHNTEDTKFFFVTDVSINIGEKLKRRFFSNLRSKYNETNDSKTSYKDYTDM